MMVCQSPHIKGANLGFTKAMAVRPQMGKHWLIRLIHLIYSGYPIAIGRTADYCGRVN